MRLFEKLVGDTGAKIKSDEPMKNHTSMGVGGNARYYVEADSLYALREITEAAKRLRIKYKIIGNGTNILVSDSGYDGIIINIRRLSDIFFKVGEVRAMAGASLNKLIDFTAKNRLCGLEKLRDIPATVGGAVVMNAGAFGSTISEHITTVCTMKNGKLHSYSKEECGFGYRKSRFLGKKEVVVSADFRLESCEKEMVIAGIRTYAEERRRIQPYGKCCGSVFKNPLNDHAGRLIDAAGLKGYTLGGACISDKHANFIMNNKNASASDVYSLIQYIKDTVRDRFGITLSEEVEYLGEF